jgi:glycosyltransferase involved in cell wall biosynthesis
MNKKKILFVTEASYLTTGYSNYTRCLLQELHDSGKYELFELGCYGHQNHPDVAKIPWTFFGNLPENDQEAAIYNSNPSNMFGLWKFDDICLKVQPDIVADFRDEWYFNWQANSAYRDFFHWVIQPTVDAEPQNEEWLATFQKADAVLTYQDWSLKVLQRADPSGLLKLKGSAVCGIEDTFKIIGDKAAHKKNCGLDPESFIIGFASRNQIRKQFGPLLRDFAKLLSELPAHKAAKTLLYLHTTYPDQGWDIPRLIKEYGLSQKVLFTYQCQNCGNANILHFQESKTFCPTCKQYAAVLPNPEFGVSREALGYIYNLMDLYVQYSNSEGLGITSIEATSCGVPLFAPNYSAMSYVVDKTRGIKLKTQDLIIDPTNGGCKRAVPDGTSFVAEIKKYMELPSDLKEKRRHETRRLALEHFSWKKCAAKWSEVFDTFPLKDVNTTWKSPPRIFTPNLQLPQGISFKDAVRWGINNILGDPRLMNTYMELKMVNDAVTYSSNKIDHINVYLNQMLQLRNSMNAAEEKRAKTL